MWKELNSFTGAYLLKLCHPWIVFFSTLTLWQHFPSCFARVWSLVSQHVRGLSWVLPVLCQWEYERWLLRSVFGTPMVKPDQGLAYRVHSIFVISDFCLLSSLIYSGSHCVGIVFSIKVLRKHRAFSDCYCFHSVFNLLFLFFCVLVP